MPSSPFSGICKLVGWDVQTGVLVKEFHDLPLTLDPQMCVFAGMAHAFLKNETPDAAAVCEDQLISLGPHWAHEGSLHFATSLQTGHGLVISIREYRPTSTPPHPVVELFHVPYHAGEFSFSPVSCHASFVTPTKVIILDVRNSNTLLHTEAAKVSYESSPGSFSPGGFSFACKTLKRDISVWKNTPTGYIPWSTVRPRLPCRGFSFSPTATSILTWGPDGIQLLRPDNRVGPSTSDAIEPYHRRDNHLVTSSADGTWIATARREGRIITILDSFSGNPRHSIDVGSRIQDMRFVRDTILVVGDYRLVGWDVETDGTREVEARAWIPAGKHLTISNDGAHIACLGFPSSDAPHPDGDPLIYYELCLYDVKSQQVVSRCRAQRRLDAGVEGVRFSPCDSELWFWSLADDDVLNHMFGSCNRLTRVGIEGGRLASVTTSASKDRLSLFAYLHSRDRFHVRSGGRWVEDSRGRKLFWLPPNWRVRDWHDTMREGNFLALVNGHHEKPIVIQFQP